MVIYVEHGALLTAVVYAFVTSCCYKIIHFFITTFFSQFEEINTLVSGGSFEDRRELYPQGRKL